MNRAGRFAKDVLTLLLTAVFIAFTVTLIAKTLSARQVREAEGTLPSPHHYVAVQANSR